MAGACIEDVTFRNIHLYYKGGYSEEDGKRIPPEQEKVYPEPWMFGTIPYIDIADKNTFHGAHRSAFRTAHTCAQPKENRCVDYISHCNITDYNIFQMSSVYRFQCQSTAMFKDTVRNRNIAETSTTFCAGTYVSANAR